MSAESFLSRWSRRKQQARRDEGAVDRSAAGPAASGGLDARDPVPVAGGSSAEGAGGREITEPEVTAEELASLPPIEELTAESDLAQFLRKGVPAAWRNAALRRIWALDPKIRDYVGEARDYAYDWNAPGGVPGSGPLAEQDIPGLLRRVIGESEPDPSPGAPQPTADPSSKMPGTEQDAEATPASQPAPAEPDRPKRRFRIATGRPPAWRSNAYLMRNRLFPVTQNAPIIPAIRRRT